LNFGEWSHVRVNGTRTSRIRRSFIAASAVSLLGLAAACGGGGLEPVADSPYSEYTGQLTASGASFPDAYMQAAIEEFARWAPDLVIDYNAVGSGTGKKEFAEGLTAFAGTDSLGGDDDGIPADHFHYLPTVAAPITVAYNVPGLGELRLGQETLAAIFQGDITSWDDPAIAADNPDADLPGTAITVVRRADGSGTTANFTKFLAEATDTWRLGQGDVVEWPARTQAGDKNTGVSQIIQQAEGAIGYIDYADAVHLGLSTAAVENRDGAFVAPTLDAATAALEGAEIADDLSYNPLNAAGADAYPITAPTYVLVRSDYSHNPVQGENTVVFLTWLVTAGQALAAEENYAALPDSLREQAIAQLEQVTW
jgi:phosphate transport system substrate-binding protein